MAPSSDSPNNGNNRHIDVIAAAHVRGRSKSRVSLATRYFEMVAQWEAIVREPTADALKQAECARLFHELIEKTARARMRQPNPPLRFYSDMTNLRDLTRPRGKFDEPLVQLAVLPAFRFVSNGSSSTSMAALLLNQLILVGQLSRMS